MEGAAGAGGGAIGVEDVFKTYVWNSTNGNLTINNGIDLAGEDGLVLMKTITSYLQKLVENIEVTKLLSKVVTITLNGKTETLQSQLRLVKVTQVTQTSFI